MSRFTRLFAFALPLSALGVLACERSADAPQRASSCWTVPSDSTIAALLAERMQHNGVGTVVGVIDGSRQSIIAHGRSGPANARSLDGATVFQLGSLTKVF